MIQKSGNSFLPAYDAMGNVHALMTVAAATINSVSYSAGDIVAAYEYDAFGQTHGCPVKGLSGFCKYLE